MNKKYEYTTTCFHLFYYKFVYTLLIKIEITGSKIQRTVVFLIAVEGIVLNA